METYTEKQAKTFDKLKGDLGYTNVMQTPKIEKIVVSSGTGKKSRLDRMVNEFIAGRLALITGQKPAHRGARKSIAGFKIRTGDPVGQMVTLRGKQAATFFDKLINVAIPRTKDFRGISRTSVDEMGNLTMGMKDHTVFPETSDEELKDVFSLSVTIVTTAQNREEALSYLEYLGVPFKEKEDISITN